MGSHHSKDLAGHSRRGYKRSTSSKSHSSLQSSTPSALYKSANFAEDGRQYHNVASSAYFLPKDDREQDRLIIHHYCLKLAFSGNLVAPVEELLREEGGKVLDIGCGPGIWALEMAHDFDKAEVHGCDFAEMYPVEIKPANAIFNLVNILDRLPYPDNHFDLVQIRTFVVALRTHEWPAAIKEVYRVLKPGGWAQFVEIDEKLWRLKGESKAFFDSAMKILQSRGFDPHIGKKVGKMLKEGGFQNVKSPRVSIPVGGWKGELGNMMLDDLVENYIGGTRLFAPAMNLDPKEFERQVRKMLADCNVCESYVNWYGNHGQKPLENLEG